MKIKLSKISFHIDSEQPLTKHQKVKTLLKWGTETHKHYGTSFCSSCRCPPPLQQSTAKAPQFQHHHSEPGACSGISSWDSTPFATGAGVVVLPSSSFSSSESSVNCDMIGIPSICTSLPRILYPLGGRFALDRTAAYVAAPAITRSARCPLNCSVATDRARW